MLIDFLKYSHLKYDLTREFDKTMEIMISAQEHGLASSIMDWTMSLDIAIEFSIHNFESKRINYTSVWILRKSAFYQICLGSDIVENKFEEVLRPAIIQFPKYNNETHLRRKFIQGGYFLIQPYQDITTSLENNLAFSEYLVLVIIPKDAVGNIWRQLASKVNLDLDACPNFNNSDKTLDKICSELNKNYR